MEHDAAAISAKRSEDRDRKFLTLAIEEAKKGVESGDGYLYGGVIVRNDEVVASGHNMVIRTNDSTTHAEILAIREAIQKLDQIDLADCEIYASVEPCPMCFGAIRFTNIKRLVYGATSKSMGSIGFTSFTSVDGGDAWKEANFPPLEIKKIDDIGAEQVFEKTNGKFI